MVVLGVELLELELLPDALLLLESELLGDDMLGDDVLGDAVLPLAALPFGQSAPTQSDELAPADVLPVAELEDGLVELDDDGVLDMDGVLVVAPADVLPVAELLVPPEAEVLELGLPVLAPADVLPELPLDAHAAQRNAAATAAVRAFKFICSPPIRLIRALRDEASKQSAHVRNNRQRLPVDRSNRSRIG